MTNYNTAGFPPVANFWSFDQTYVAVGSTLSFADLSTGQIDSWNWAFEGGFPATSVAQNPAPIFYNNPGLFDVSLTVSNAFGSSTKLNQNYVDVGYVPDADFTATFEAFVDRVEYQFSDASTHNPNLWYWNFEGGVPEISGIQNPMVTYTTDGTFDVSLTAMNLYGDNTVIKTGYVVINLTSVKDIEYVTMMKIMPNPAKNQCLISDLIPGTWIKIYDLTGKIVFENQIFETSITIPLEEMPKGILLIEASLFEGGHRSTAKLIHQ